MSAPKKGGRPPRVTPERWLELQALWEREPTEDYGSIAERAGVSKERVRQKVVEMGWRRKADLQHVNQVAQVKADAHFAPAVQPGQEVQQLAAPPRPAPLPGAPQTRVEMAAEERSAELRADIAVRHRNEWRVVRGLLNEAVNRRDMGKAKLAKTTAETLKIAQEGERKAWGMDAPETTNSSATVKVVIEREEVKHGE